MLEFLVEKTGDVFSRKVEFLLFAGPQQLCFPTVRGLACVGSVTVLFRTRELEGGLSGQDHRDC